MLVYSKWMSTRYQDDHYFLLFCTLPRYLWAYNLNLIGWLWQRLYTNHHDLYHIHYMNLDVRHNLLWMATFPFRPYVMPSIIPDKVIPCGWLCQCTTFYFPYFLTLSLHLIWTIFCLVRHQPHFQHTPWLRAPPSVGYLRASIPWSLWIFSPTGPFVGFLWINLQAFALWCSIRLEYCYFQPSPSQINKVYQCA